MKDVKVYVSRELLNEIGKDKLEFAEFIAKLHGVFGTWDRMRTFEPFKDLTMVLGEDLVTYRIPAKLGMLIGLKKLCLRYGAANFIFAAPEKDVETDFVLWDEILEKIFKYYKKEI